MISLSIADGVAEVVLNAPQKLNSLDEQALADLSQAYDDAAAAASRGEVRALLLRGEGAPFARAGTSPASRRRTTTPRRTWAGWCSRCCRR
jgi:2-(1,2-epoxy-1,2-dihydrophenyl)acetyl-CoA isomerase